LNLLKPRLNTHEEDSWEELETVDIGGGAGSLRWLVWVCMEVLYFCSNEVFCTSNVLTQSWCSFFSLFYSQGLMTTQKQP
jgi:hypothetical protein